MALRFRSACSLHRCWDLDCRLQRQQRPNDDTSAERHAPRELHRDCLRLHRKQHRRWFEWHCRRQRRHSPDRELTVLHRFRRNEMRGNRFATAWLRFVANSCCAVLLVVFATGCGGGGSSAPPPPPPPPPAASIPAFWPVPGAYSQTSAGQSITLTDSTSGATIYYTTDGSPPTTSSTIYTNPIAIMATATIKAIATASGFSSSALATRSYTPTPPRT